MCAAPGRILLLTSSVSRTAAPRSSRLRLPTSLARLPRLSRGSSCHIIMVTIVRWEGGWRHLEAGLHEGEAAVGGLVPEAPGRGVAVSLLQLRPPHLAHVPRLSEGGIMRMLRFQKRYCASRDYCVNYHEISMTPLAISRYIYSYWLTWAGAAAACSICTWGRRWPAPAPPPASRPSSPT